MRHGERALFRAARRVAVTRIPRALVVAHWTLVEPAIAAAVAELGLDHVDLLAYGVGAEGLADHSRGELLRLPVWRGDRRAVGRSLLAFARAIRRHRYAAVIVAQPGLRVSRARGLLLSFPFVARSDRVLALEPQAERLVGVGRGEALVDLLRWLLVQAWCSV